jgi:hypothetical protein
MSDTCPVHYPHEINGKCQLVHIHITEDQRNIEIRYNTRKGQNVTSNIYVGKNGQPERIKRELLNFIYNFMGPE